MTWSATSHLAPSHNDPANGSNEAAGLCAARTGVPRPSMKIGWTAKTDRISRAKGTKGPAQPTQNLGRCFCDRWTFPPKRQIRQYPRTTQTRSSIPGHYITPRFRHSHAPLASVALGKNPHQTEPWHLGAIDTSTSRLTQLPCLCCAADCANPQSLRNFGSRRKDPLSETKASGSLGRTLLCPTPLRDAKPHPAQRPTFCAAAGSLQLLGTFARRLGSARAQRDESTDGCHRVADSSIARHRDAPLRDGCFNPPIDRLIDVLGSCCVRSPGCIPSAVSTFFSLGLRLSLS